MKKSPEQFAIGILEQAQADIASRMPPEMLIKQIGDRIKVLKDGLPVRRYSVIVQEKYTHAVEVEATAAPEANIKACHSVKAKGEGAYFVPVSCKEIRS